MTRLPNMLFFLFIFITTFSYGQNHFLPCTIARFGGEEESGLINYKNWNVNPERIEFIKKGGAVSTFTLSDLSSFDITLKDKTHERYERAIVEIDKSLIDINKLDYDPQPKFEKDTAFLLVLVQGTANLYYLKDNDHKVHFFMNISDAEQISELVYKKYLIGNKGGVAANYLYRFQIMNIASDCINTSSLEYKIAPLIEAFKVINKCKGNTGNYIYQINKIKLEPFVSCGISLANLRFEGDFDDLTSKHFSESYSFSGGIGIDFKLPRTRDKLAITNELLFTHYTSRGVYKYQTSPNVSFEERLKYTANYIKINTSLKWYLYEMKVSPYLKAGISNGFALKVEQAGEVERTPPGSFNVQVYEPLTGLRRYEQGLLFGAGMTYDKRKIGIELRLNLTNGFYNSLYATSLVKYYFFLLNYSF